MSSNSKASLGDNIHFSNDDIDAITADPKKNYFTPILKDALEIINKKNLICDIGCGNGIFTGKIKDYHSCNLTGVDGSDYALSKANKLDYDKLVKIKDFSNDTLPFKDKTFDFVINKDVLEHLVNPSNLVSEIARIIVDDGYALFHVPNHFTIFGRLKFLFSNNIDTFNYFPDSKAWNFPHIRFYTKESFIELLEIFGFSIEKDLSFYFGRLPIFWRFLPFKFRKFLFNKFSNSFCEGFTFLAKKVK